MRDAVFLISTRADGTLMAECPALSLVVCAMDRDSLQEEARDALITAVGAAEGSYRVRLQRSEAALSVAPRPMRQQRRSLRGQLQSCAAQGGQIGQVGLRYLSSGRPGGCAAAVEPER